MFDINHAIIQWRRKLTDAGIDNPDVIAELESHLRDEIEARTAAGMEPERAFEFAARKIGQARGLQQEFARARGWRNLMFRTGAGAKLSMVVALCLSAGLGVVSLVDENARRWFVFGLLAAGFFALFAWRRSVRLGAVDFDPEALALSTSEALVLAREEARGFNHDFVGTEHLLLGLLSEPDGRATKVLAGLGVTSAGVRAEIEKLVGVGVERSSASELPYTPRARQAMALAHEEAKALQQHRVEAEHVLLGLTREPTGVAGRVLASLRVDPDQVRQQILHQAGGPAGPT